MAKRRFTETLHGDEAFQGFTIEQDLYIGSSPYQSIEIVQTKRFGRVLILDGIVQTTELDEFVYHEMLVHVPMFSHSSPRRVLIIGGGDGGALREVLKHDIDQVDMIEIDEKVVSSCVEHMPSLNNAGAVYDDPRTNLIIEDAFAYLAREQSRYDVIISDSTDPVGAGEILFSQRFYELCENALNADGIVALQNGVAFLQPHESRGTMRALRRLGLFATCYQVAVPTYYGGLMMLAYATRQREALLPNLQQIEARFNRCNGEFKHYNPPHHLGSFALPQWVQTITGECHDSTT
ncbi:MAG: spermidine synthase [Gammaproteobacteria bacterium]